MASIRHFIFQAKFFEVGSEHLNVDDLVISDHNSSYFKLLLWR